MKPKLPPPNLSEVAAEHGIDVARGYVAELAESRDEVLKTHGRGDLKTYRKLLVDDQVMPTFHQRRARVVAREWHVEPGGDSEDDKRAADVLREDLQRVGWDRVSYKMLLGIMFGYSVAECMFRVDDAGLVRLDAIKVRRAERFAFAKDGHLRLRKNGDTVAVPDCKFWTVTFGAEDDDDYYGLGLGHSLYWPCWFKRNGLKFWVEFLEWFSMPTPKAVVPPGTQPEERNKLLELLSKVRRGGKIVVPRGVDLDLIQAARDSAGDFDRFVDRMDKSIAKIVLMQTMTTEDGSSMSQAKVHDKVANAGAKSDSDLLTESFMTGPAAWLTEWNFPGAKTPIIYRDFSEVEDLAASADRDVKLAQIGWRPTAERIRETYGEGYEYAPPQQPLPGGFGPAFAEVLPATSESVDDLLSRQGWRRVIGPEVEAIEQLLKSARSLEEVRARLDEIAARDPHALTKALARLMFTARVAGNVEADPRDGDG